MTAGECPQCHQFFKTKEVRQVYCCRRCARIAQAMRGVPSLEDRKMALLDAVAQKFDELFKEKK